MPEQLKVDLVIVYTTFPDQEAAETICKSLVEDRFAACANIFPSITAIYEWQGSLGVDQECAAFLKTSSSKVGSLSERLKVVHPYETPAIVELPASGVDEDYLAWVKQQTVGA